MKNENFYVVQGWMVNELGLSGNELMVYAIIYGFSQDHNSWFDGSLSYLSSFINCKSKTTIFNTLKELTDKGLIEKQEYEVNNVRFCKYRTVYQNLIYPVSKNDTHYNIINNKEKNIIIDNNIPKEKFKKPTIEEIQEYCDERKNGVNATYFYDFYESKGWMIGKNKVKDWKACVRTWERNQKKEVKSNKPIPEWFNKNITIEEEQMEDEEFKNFIENFRK